MNNDKPEVYWVQDSGGEVTCHINDGALDFKQSLIGTLEYRLGSWHVILKDGKDLAPEEGFNSLSRARTCMETHYCGEKPARVATHMVSRANPVRDKMQPRSAQPDKYACTCRNKEIDKTNCPKHREF